MKSQAGGMKKAEALEMASAFVSAAGRL